MGKRSQNWQEIKLGTVCDKIGSGATPRGGSGVYIGEGVSLIRSQNVHNEGFKRNGLAHIGATHARQLAGVTVEHHDVLLNITGDSVARTCQVDSSILPARVNQHVAIIRPRKEFLTARYLRYALVQPSMQQHLLGLASSGATRNALTKQMIEDLTLFLPPLSEQRAIAAVLSSLDDKIELLRRQNETLENIGQTIFKEWFVEFNFPDKDSKPYKASGGKMVESDLGLIPNGWQLGTIADVADIFDSKRVPLSGQVRAKRPGIYPYYGATTIMDYIDDYLFNGVYLLLAEDGSVVTDDGFPVLQYVWGQFWVNNHAHILQGREEFSTELLFLFFKQKPVSEIITGAVQLKINQGNLLGVDICIPEGRVLSRFNELTTSLFNKLRANADQITDLSQIRDTLLPKLMSGALRVVQY